MATGSGDMDEENSGLGVMGLQRRVLDVRRGCFEPLWRTEDS